MLHNHFNFLRHERQTQKQELKTSINQLLSLDLARLVTNSEVLDLISKQDVRWLETNGIIVAKHTVQNPLGTFAADDFGNSKKSIVLNNLDSDKMMNQFIDSNKFFQLELESYLNPSYFESRRSGLSSIQKHTNSCDLYKHFLTRNRQPMDYTNSRALRTTNDQSPNHLISICPRRI